MISEFNANGLRAADGEAVDPTRALQDAGLGSYLDSTTSFKGVIESVHSVGIDGKVEGEIHSQTGVVIGREAEVQGSIWGETVIIAGYVVGDVTSSALELQAKARLRGKVRTGSMLVAVGAIFLGECSVGNEDQSSQGRFQPPPQPVELAEI